MTDENKFPLVESFLESVYSLLDQFDCHLNPPYCQYYIYKWLFRFAHEQVHGHGKYKIA